MILLHTQPNYWVDQLQKQFELYKKTKINVINGTHNIVS